MNKFDREKQLIASGLFESCYSNSWFKFTGAYSAADLYFSTYRYCWYYNIRSGTYHSTEEIIEIVPKEISYIIIFNLDLFL